MLLHVSVFFLLLLNLSDVMGLIMFIKHPKNFKHKHMHAVNGKELINFTLEKAMVNASGH